MADRVGQQLGNYRLTRRLGEGGFAEVYLGEHIHLGTQAAIKVLKAKLASDDVEKFRTEARTIANLDHPNIVRVLDFGLEDDTPFLVMDFAPNGMVRKSYPKGTRLPLVTIVTFVKQVATALQYAHGRKLVHRDIKPENMLLGRNNEVLLSDFGIAVVAHGTGSLSMQEAIGTVQYMAPEQFQGKAQPASDQYALGIIVYEWLCGERPFNGTSIEVAMQHALAPVPSLCEKVSTILPDVEQVVMTALAKDPHQRFGSIQAFANAFEQACQLSKAPALASPPPPTILPTESNPVPVGKHTNVLPQVPTNSMEELFQEGVRAQASGRIEETFQIWRQIMTTPGIAERYATTARNRMRELRTQMVPLRLKQAREASQQGRWQDEIRLWEDLLALEAPAQEIASLLTLPLTLVYPIGMPYQATSNPIQSIQERLQIARQNQENAWMYTSAQRFMQNRDSAAARTQLQMLWHDAPRYGDPAGLAQMTGLPRALNYEQAIAAEQPRLEQERRERERLERERTEQAEEQARHMEAEQQRNNEIVIVLILVGTIIGGALGGLGVGGGGVGGALGGAGAIAFAVVVVARVVAKVGGLNGSGIGIGDVVAVAKRARKILDRLKNT